MRRLSLAPIVALAALAVAVRAPAGAAVDDHAHALAALADVRATIGEIVHIEDGNAVGHGAYLRAAHRALNALVGRRDDGYVPSFGDPGDRIGALGHIDMMLDVEGTSRWTPALEGAKANALAAAENLQTATGEREMEEYQADLTHALANLALVIGRASQDGVFGGISGALANTELGVPLGATSVSGCALPARTPAYGVVSGRLAYIALPRASASSGLPEDLSITRVVVRGDDVVLYTSAAADATSVCRAPHHQREATRRRRLERAARIVAAAGGTPVPPLFTAEQARAGAAVYAASCIQCHGADLQGTAGPSVAGNDFLTTAKTNHWHLSDLRTTVVQNMPFSDPGSLTPKQYANVLAFLLASNCYPAGATPFPTTDRPTFASLPLGPHAAPAGATRRAKTGTCPVK
jgi:hypothetical protein